MAGMQSRFLLLGGVIVLLAICIVSLVLIYVFPSPPTKVTIATAFKGGSYDYYGQRYREKFAQANVDLVLRETDGGLENLKLLRDADADVQIGISTAGVADGNRSSDVYSLGMIDYLPIWIFYPVGEPFDHLSQIKGKRIAIGPAGSATHFLAEQILRKAGINAANTTFVNLAGSDAVKALNDEQVDIVWIVGVSSASAIQSLFRNPRVRLVSVPMADALTRIFPYLSKLTVPQGAIDIDKDIPPSDVTLVGSNNRILVRSDVHPTIINLLLQTMVQVHGEPQIFQRAHEFPTAVDPEFEVAPAAVEFYKNGPSLLQRHLPLWLTVHVQRAIALMVAVVAVGVPLLHYLPMIYKWSVRRRLLYWYGRLMAFEGTLSVDEQDVGALRGQLDEIERAVNRMRFPLTFSDQVYNLRGHIEYVRRRIAAME